MAEPTDGALASQVSPEVSSPTGDGSLQASPQATPQDRSSGAADEGSSNAAVVTSSAAADDASSIAEAASSSSAAADAAVASGSAAADEATSNIAAVSPETKLPSEVAPSEHLQVEPAAPQVGSTDVKLEVDMIGIPPSGTEAAPARPMATSSAEDASPGAELTSEGLAKSSLEKTVMGKLGVDSNDLEAAKPDIEPLLKLLEKPPAEVAAWAVEQARDLGQAETLVESTPIFKVAGALRAAPVDKKEALMSRVIQGVGDLPVEQRAEAVRFIAQLPSTKPADLLKSSASSEALPLFATNFSRVAEEVAIKEMAPEEFTTLAKAMEKEQGQLIQPLLDVVPELSEAERSRISESLVANGVVPKEHRQTLDDAIKPGGHADQLANLVRWIAFAHTYSWLVWALPIFESIVAVAIVSLGCSAPLLIWLVIDAVLGFGAAGCAFGVKYYLKSAYAEFREDPLAMVSRVQAAMAEGSSVNDVVPGSRSALYCFVALVVLVVLGGILAIGGILQLLATMWAACPAVQRLTAIIACAPIICLRMGLVVGTILLVRKGVAKFKEYKGETQTSSPLVAESEANYGSAATSAGG